MRKKWEEMCKEEKRVAIARDVIAKLRREFIKPEAGTYFSPVGHSSCRLKEIKQCRTCALGSMLVGFLSKSKSDKRIVFSTNRNVIARELRGIFTIGELTLIESAFERRAMGTRDYFEKHTNAAIQFGFSFESPYDRLLAIMQNIIDHRGVFKPEVEYVICRV